MGFYGGRWICNLCGQDYFRACPHLAGLQYESQDGDVVRLVLATVGVHEAHLAEVSAVFDGSTPDATIIKARTMAASGNLKPEAVNILNARYGIKLEVKRSFAGATAPERKPVMNFEEMVVAIRTAVKAAPEADLVGVVTGLVNETEQLRSTGEQVTALQQRITELEPRAKDGDTYRNDLVETALAEGIRAFGDQFDKAGYETMLRGLPIANIKQMSAAWTKIGDATLSGGRSSDDGTGEAGVGAARKTKLPDKAFAV